MVEDRDGESVKKLNLKWKVDIKVQKEVRVRSKTNNFETNDKAGKNLDERHRRANGRVQWFIVKVKMENYLDSSMIIFLFLEIFYCFLYLINNDIM